MNNWQVTYTRNGKTVTKYYASMNTATAAVSRLALQGISANYSPVWQGGNTI